MENIRIGFARVLSAFLLLSLVGCGGKPDKPEADAQPGMAEFRSQVMRFVEAGTEANAKANQGVPYAELQAQVVTVKAAHELMLAVWPDKFPADGREDFARAIRGWDLALALWALKIEKGDVPTAPDVNGFDRFLAFGLEELEVQTHGKDYLVADYRGKNYLPFDANIEVLLKIAGTSFEAGRGKVLSGFEKKAGAH
jgi:hypothetical protein